MDILRGRLQVRVQQQRLPGNVRLDAPRAQASEGSHFKREQEDELKEYRRCAGVPFAFARSVANAWRPALAAFRRLGHSK